MHFFVRITVKWAKVHYLFFCSIANCSHFFLISSLKWYKDDVEFYSYIPRMKEGSKKRFFDLPGVFIDVSILVFLPEREAKRDTVAKIH